MNFVAEKYKPILYFHSKETHFPISEEIILKYGKKYDKNKKEIMNNNTMNNAMETKTDVHYLNIDSYDFLHENDDNRKMYFFYSNDFYLYGKKYYYITYYVLFSYNSGFLFGKHFSI